MFTTPLDPNELSTSRGSILSVELHEIVSKTTISCKKNKTLDEISIFVLIFLSR